MFYKKKIKRQKWIFCNADANANPDADANVEISTWPLLYHKSIICCKTVRTERNGNPQQIWTEGFYRLAPTNMNGLLELKDSSLYGIDDDGPIPELKTADDIQVPEREIYKYRLIKRIIWLLPLIHEQMMEILEKKLSFKFETRSRSCLSTRNNCCFS